MPPIVADLTLGVGGGICSDRYHRHCRHSSGDHRFGNR
jgi:hypothetical protein